MILFMKFEALLPERTPSSYEVLTASVSFLHLPSHTIVLLPRNNGKPSKRFCSETCLSATGDLHSRNLVAILGTSFRGNYFKIRHTTLRSDYLRSVKGSTVLVEA